MRPCTAATHSEILTLSALGRESTVTLEKAPLPYDTQIASDSHAGLRNRCSPMRSHG
jgi:hypothetical protein